MGKFAFCIIAHNEPDIFKALIRQIDNPENDIFVMIDKKADITLFNQVSAQYSQLFFCQDRINIKWGTFSQVKAELTLFEYAYNKGNYKWFHLLSGQDLLIKPVTELNAFVESHSHIQFMQMRNPEEGRSIVQYRVSYFHFLQNFRNKSSLILRLLPNIIINFQKLVGIRRNKKYDYPMGANWVSITRDFLEEILIRQKEIFKIFHHTLCADELYKQYILETSSKRFKVFSERKELGMTLRKIDWVRGRPYTWQEEDFNELIESEDFIARKINSQNGDLVKNIVNFTSRSK